MKKILGLDLGTTSIGWALIEQDVNNTPSRIIDLGSRIIPLSSVDRDQFQKGQSISKNQDRRNTKNQRKNYDRKQLKKQNLNKFLIEHKIYPTEELLKLPMLELWKLRSDAANPDVEITPQQLGRIFYMLNQKRGYKSARNENSTDQKDTEYVHLIKSRYEKLKDKNLTIGQDFYNELLKSANESTYFRIKEKIYPREAYIEEFDKIINAQKNKHSFLTDTVIHQLRNKIIYFQRSLKSQKGLVSICTLEGVEKKVFIKKKNKEKHILLGPKVSPRTSPLFQLCRIWELVNNLTIKVKNEKNNKYKWQDKLISIEEKEVIVKELFANGNLSFNDLLKILKLKKEQVYANKQITKGLKGNETFQLISNIIGDHPLLEFNPQLISTHQNSLTIDTKTGEILKEVEVFEIDKRIEFEPFYQLWHTIYSIKNLQECKKALIKRFNFSDKDAELLSKIDLNTQGYGNKSNKAMRKILPYLFQGQDYAQACINAGYNHSQNISKEEKKDLNTENKLELLEKNSLRQPVVEKILNQMINVVNSIIDKHGKPDEIRVELARELKQSKDERNHMDYINSKNKKLNEDICKKLKELGLPQTKRYIQKYKFIYPSLSNNIKDAKVNNICLYCGEAFNLTQALSGAEFDIDHIIPKTLLFDDSQTNKILVHRKCNSKKNNLTAYDFIATKGSDELDQYLHRVDDWFKRGIVSYSKMTRLKTSYNHYVERKKNKKETETDKKLWESFINRQLRETQYIAKKSRELLQKVCINVTATEGNVTSKLRNLWGWDDVLMNLQMPKYRALEQTIFKEWTSENGKRKHKKEEIIDWSKRDDHRHHAIDALVIACTKQGYIQRINTLNATDTKEDLKFFIEKSNIKFQDKATLLEKYLISQKPFSTDLVMKEADKILISFKSGKRVASISKYKAKGINQTKGVIVPRGELHEQSIYGKIKTISKDKSLKFLFENSDMIVNQKIKTLVKSRIKEYNNNPTLAYNSLKKDPIFLNNEKTMLLETSDCYKDATVLKYNIHKLNINQIKDIVDKKIKEIITNRLEEYNNKPNDAFKDTIWLNKEKQIPIKSVRLFARPDADNLQSIKKDINGKDIGFVLTGNNHHIAIYVDENKKISQHICTFWHAVERKKYNIPVIIKDTFTEWTNLLSTEFPDLFLSKLPKDNLKLKVSLQQNEMFILGLSEEDFQIAYKQNNTSLLSKHLYLVWSISNNDYWFRHHLETKNTELKNIKTAKEAKRYFRFKSVGALLKENPIKIKLNHLGEIVHIGEY